jgi:nicotinamidase/pyrazinamidase
MKAFIIVDMQNDFMPGGALGVAGADQLIPIINALMPHFKLVVSTQDWHPPGHCSFASSHPGKKPGDVVDVQGIPQILWPVHCVRDTFGAELVAGLNQEAIASTFYKGTDPGTDGYSAFFDNAHKRSTGLGDYLKSRKVTDVYIAGVATDYCVLYSTLDALDLGFAVYVIADACRGINLKPADVDNAWKDITARGGNLISKSLIIK